MGNGNRGGIAAVIAAASVAVLLAGCTGAEDGSPTIPSAVVVSPSSSATPPSEATPTPSSPDGATGADSYVGSWGTVDRQSPHLVIVADGTFTGSDGCNTLRGAWELEDDGSIEFDDVAMTRMACEGVDQTLNRLDSATVAGDELTVYGDDVITLITLPRTG